MSTTYKMCSCNRTMPLGTAAGERIGRALGCGALPVAHQLCGAEAPSFVDAAQAGNTVVVACTQEAALFRELAQDSGGTATLRFVNIRETAGWGAEAPASLPKMAALLADAARPAPEPLPTVTYASQGRLLIVGPADDALAWAGHLHGELAVTVLLTSSGPRTPLPAERDFPVLSGTDITVDGWLGNFNVQWRQANPVDLDLCVRCNACIDACPEQAIGFDYQVDEGACRRHGDCVAACGPVGAIDFNRAPALRSARFDLVLDLSGSPLLPMHQPPQGYVAPGPALSARLAAATMLAGMVGSFEKPKYFRYKERLCAHARNGRSGCSACIDTCSAAAIRADGDRIRVEPHLCVGCGACTTVCPTGALGYADPDVPATGQRLRELLRVYRAAGGERPLLLFHGKEHGAALIASLGRMARRASGLRGLPASVIPVELQHPAAAGIDVWLAALCYGAEGIAVLVTDGDAPAYRSALRQQAGFARAIMNGLGYAGRHVDIVEAADAATLDAGLHSLAPAAIPAARAGFHLQQDKRNTLDFVLDHLWRHAPVAPEQVALPDGAPFGAIAVDTDACTLCMACTGACPASALQSNAERPQLRFIEKNCVQCGLCADTCPEQAIALVPRLLAPAAAQRTAVLHEAEPFHCIRCGKAIGTLKAIENMLARLGSHAAFAGNADRLRMCGDCRVVDMMATSRATVTELHRAS